MSEQSKTLWIVNLERLTDGSWLVICKFKPQETSDEKYSRKDLAEALQLLQNIEISET